MNLPWPVLIIVLCLALLNLLAWRAARKERVRLTCALELELHFKTKWCSVCGVVYQRHPGEVPSSPPYTPPCAGGHWEQ